MRKRSHPWTTQPTFQKRWEGKVRLLFSWTPRVGRIPEAHQTQGRRKWKSFQAHSPVETGWLVHWSEQAQGPRVSLQADAWQHTPLDQAGMSTVLMNQVRRSKAAARESSTHLHGPSQNQRASSTSHVSKSSTSFTAAASGLSHVKWCLSRNHSGSIDSLCSSDTHRARTRCWRLKMSRWLVCTRQSSQHVKGLQKVEGLSASFFLTLYSARRVQLESQGLHWQQPAQASVCYFLPSLILVAVFLRGFSAKFTLLWFFFFTKWILYRLSYGLC